MLEVLLAVPFPGSEELRAQLGYVKVTEEYDGEDPSVIFSVDQDAALPAPARRRIPVEAEGLDEDGTMVQVLLHVLDGYVWELEIYRPDGEPLKRAPDARSLTPYSLDRQDQVGDRIDRAVGTA